MTGRPFRLVSIQTVDGFPSATTRPSTLATYATLAAAVSAGKEKLHVRPDLLLRVYERSTWIRGVLGGAS